MIPLPPMDAYIGIFRLLLGVVDIIGKLTSGREKRGPERLEDGVLDYLNMKQGNSSLEIIHNDVIIKPIISDVPFKIAFPSESHGWQRVRLEWERLPYDIRHRWRIWRQYADEQEVLDCLKKLLRDRRISYNPVLETFSSKI